jgi:hypothetical protein
MAPESQRLLMVSCGLSMRTAEVSPSFGTLALPSSAGLLGCGIGQPSLLDGIGDEGTIAMVVCGLSI